MTSGSLAGIDNTELLSRFARVFVEDDNDLLFTLLASDCEWTVMPTGERFVGLDQIRSLTEKVQAARTHSDEAKLVIRDAFCGAGHLCIEFLHRGIVTGGFEGDADGPAAGSTFEIDFCVTALVTGGKIIRVREYFDPSQFTTPPGERVKFFS